jgi:hypothetical protein
LSEVFPLFKIWSIVKTIIDLIHIFIYDGEKSITNLVYGICQEFINKIKQKVFIESPFTTHDFTHFHFMLEKILETTVFMFSGW